MMSLYSTNSSKVNTIKEKIKFMKKIIFSAVSATLSMIGFSAFKTANKTFNVYYRFSINVFESASTANPIGEVYNSDINFIIKATTLPASDFICNESNNYYCVIGFSAEQVESIANYFVLKNTYTVPATAPKGLLNIRYVRSSQ